MSADVSEAPSRTLDDLCQSTIATAGRADQLMEATIEAANELRFKSALTDQQRRLVERIADFAELARDQMATVIDAAEDIEGGRHD